MSYGNVLNSEYFLVGQYQHLKLDGYPNQPASTEGVRPPGASYGACVRLDCIPLSYPPLPRRHHDALLLAGQHLAPIPAWGVTLQAFDDYAILLPALLEEISFLEDSPSRVG